MANFFDQFDPPSKGATAAPQAAPAGGNFFDQFDPVQPAPAARASLASPAASVLDAAKDIGRSFESGADIGGVAGLVGLPNAAIGLADNLLGYPARAIVRATGRTPASEMPGGDQRPSIADGFPTTDGVTGAMEQVTGQAYKPQTTAGEVARTLGEFAPNALAGGAGAALRVGETVAQTAARVAARRSDLLGKGTVAQVVAPALTSEGAGRVAREVAPEAEPYARFTGALAGGVGAAVAQAPRGAGMVREGLEGFTAEQVSAAQALRAEARAMPGGGIDLPLDEALNQVTGGQATRLSQIARVVANSGGEGQRIAGQTYAARPGQVEAAGRAAFDGLAEKNMAPTALGGAVQDAARAGMARTPEGMALTEARIMAGPRVTPEQAGQVIQPELRRAYEGREGMRAALGEQDYAAAKAAPETVGIERTIPVERPGEPRITQPAYSRPQFEDGAPRPVEPYTPPAADGTGPAGKSLARFIAENGGLRLDGDAAATDLQRFMVPGVGKVARPDGKSLDSFWRERLIEEGYFRPDADGGMARDISSELLRKLQNEQRGFPSYPLDSAGRSKGRAGAGQQADEYANARSLAEGRLDEDLARVGVDPRGVHPDIRDRTVGALMRGEHSDPLDAYERTVGAMKGPLDPYVKSTTIREEIPDVRFGQVNPAGVLDHVQEAMRSAKGPALLALQQARKTLFEQDGKTLDLSVAGLHGAREAINDLIGKAEPTAQRALMGVRDRLDRSLSSVPEYEQARAGFEAASRNLDPFEGSAPGRIVAQDQASRRFTMPPERAPLAIDEGPSAGRAFNEVASPQARAAYEGHLTTSLLDGATDAATGEISGKALRKAMRANEDQLAQFPGVRERLSNIAVAQDGMAAVERSPLGQIAQKPKVKHAIGVLFDRQPVAGGEAEIGSAMGALAKSDPISARQLARLHLETVFDDAVKEKRGLPAQYGGAGFASAVAGSPQQGKNLEAAIRALPEGDVLWSGLDRFMTVLRATGYRPQKGSDTAFNARIQDELKGGGGVGGAVATVVSGSTAGAGIGGAGGSLAGGVLAAKRSASDAWTRYRIGQNGDAVARMLFDPKALADLRHLVKSGPGSKNEQYFAGRLLALAAGGSAPGERGQRQIP